MRDVTVTTIESWISTSPFLIKNSLYTKLRVQALDFFDDDLCTVMTKGPLLNDAVLW